MQSINPPQGVRRGGVVITQGPWSHGHDEQCAIVTHVWGDGAVPGILVNLHVFVDEGESLICSGVPWYPTRAQALAAVYPLAGQVMGGPVVCWLDSED